MRIEVVYDGLNRRHKVWCKNADLKAGAVSGTYEFVDDGVSVGEGSEVIVIDKPGCVLFSDDGGVLYEWTKGGANDTNEEVPV